MLLIIVSVGLMGSRHSLLSYTVRNGQDFLWQREKMTGKYIWKRGDIQTVFLIVLKKSEESVNTY